MVHDPTVHLLRIHEKLVVGWSEVLRKSPALGFCSFERAQISIALIALLLKVWQEMYCFI